MKKEPLKLDDETRVQLKELFAQAKAAGHGKIIVPFSGSGDEGSTQGAETEGCKPIEGQIGADFDEVAQKIAQDHGTDWWNNDGGHGQVNFNIAAGTIEIEMNTYETISNEEPTRVAEL